jgi:hypothetical protein
MDQQALLAQGVLGAQQLHLVTHIIAVQVAVAVAAHLILEASLVELQLQVMAQCQRQQGEHK